MPTVIVECASGRTLEQKRKLVRDLTNAVMENFKVDGSHVTVLIHEMPREDIATNGTLLSDK